MVKNKFKYFMILFVFSMKVMYGGEELKMGNILEKCQGSPNCITSLEEMKGDSNYVEPILFGDEAIQEVEGRLISVLEKLDGKIVEKKDGYIKVEFSSKIFKFKDVAEFIILADKKLIMVRSEAQTGWSDFGVNRKRMEKIRVDFSILY